MTPTNTPEAARLAEERQRFEAEAIARTWAYRSEHGLRFYPSHDGGGDLWKGWLAAKQDAAPTSASTVPAGFWLAPMEPDEEMWTEGRDPIMYRDLGDYRPASFDVPAWQREPDGSINHDKSKGTAAVRVWRAMRDSWIARNPGACSVTDGEAKK